MKVFEFRWPGGEKDWVLAEDKNEAKGFYLRHTGCGDLGGCVIRALSEKELKDHYILDVDVTEDYEDPEINEDDYCNGYKIIETFADYAARETATDMIATTKF